jgi:hypothetical protein
VFYYILPYPSQRQIWPNFQSALLFDVVAIFTYFTISAIFFYIGMVPDIAAARDHLQYAGKRGYQERLYRLLALGWHGGSEQWRHYGRAYLFFAALATPLVPCRCLVDATARCLAGTPFPTCFVAGPSFRTGHGADAPDPAPQDPAL